MFYLLVFRILALVLMVVFAYTQIFKPMFKGTKLFPWFSNKRTTLEKEFINTRENIEIHNLEKKLKELKDSDQSTQDQTSSK